MNLVAAGLLSLVEELTIGIRLLVVFAVVYPSWQAHCIHRDATISLSLTAFRFFPYLCPLNAGLCRLFLSFRSAERCRLTGIYDPERKWDMLWLRAFLAQFIKSF